MGFIRNFLIWIIKNIIILLVVTLIFSTITLDLPRMLKGLFGDIFEYASPEMQENVVRKLAESCSALEGKQSVVTVAQICGNKTLLTSIQENCRSFRLLRARGLRVENDATVQEMCRQVDSGQLQNTCNQIESKNTLLPNLEKIGALCEDYKEKRINDKEFFFGVVSGALPEQFQTPKIGILEKYNQLVNYLNNNKVLYFGILIILMVLLYLLAMNILLFLMALSGVLFSIGIVIILPYAAILAYDKLVGIDTTSMLGTMFGAGSFDPKAIVSVVLLMLLRTYNGLIITLGFLFLAIGVVGKIYARLHVGKPKQATNKRDKKMKKLVGELKESMDKKKKKS